MIVEVVLGTFLGTFAGWQVIRLVVAEDVKHPINCRVVRWTGWRRDAWLREHGGLWWRNRYASRLPWHWTNDADVVQALLRAARESHVDVETPTPARAVVR